MYKYQVNLFTNGSKVYSEEKELSSDVLLGHSGKLGREAFLSLINSWNRTGMIGFENHGKTWLYVAM